jgi:hypothetical protein
VFFFLLSTNYFPVAPTSLATNNLHRNPTIRQSMGLNLVCGSTTSADI